MLAAYQTKLTLGDWLDLNAVISRVTGSEQYRPEILTDGEFEPLTREELPTDV